MTAEKNESRLPGRLLTFAGVVSLSVTVCLGCAAGDRRPSGPPPEYEPPQVLPWDSGGPEDSEDPFASAAVGGWLEEPDSGAGAEPIEDGGGVGVETGSPSVPAKSRDAGGVPAREPASEGAESPADRILSDGGS